MKGYFVSFVITSKESDLKITFGNMFFNSDNNSETRSGALMLINEICIHIKKEFNVNDKSEIIVLSFQKMK